MPTRTEPEAIASQCLAAWSSGDLEATRSVLHDDVSYTGPLGETHGADAYIEAIQGRLRGSRPQAGTASATGRSPRCAPRRAASG
jgi:ketosteroid isomerase-like protein